MGPSGMALPLNSADDEWPVFAGSDEALREALATLSAHIHAATYRLIALIGEMEKRAAWFESGVLTCAHWLSWQCGINLGAAREKVRVAKALEHLPHIRERFATGALSYSKVRALTRIATPENELTLLEYAKYGSASQVERIVRAYRGVIQREERDIASRDGTANARYEAREVDVSYEEDGSMLIRVRLPPENGSRVMAALNDIVAVMHKESRAAEERVQTAADVLPSEEMVPSDNLAVRPGPAMVEATIGEQTSSNTLTDVPAERATAVPAGVYGLKDPSYPVVPYAARQADALLRMVESHFAHEERSSSGGDRHQIVVHVDAAVLKHPANAGACTVDGQAWISGTTARRLACDAGIVRLVQNSRGEPLDLGRKTRSISPALNRALAARNESCQFPGCTHRYHLDAHHVQHWAEGGPTTLDNLVRLCHYHHVLVHEGGFDVRAVPAKEGERQQFMFVRPNGVALPSWVPSKEGDCETLITENEERGLSMSKETAGAACATNDWDLALAIDILCQSDGRTEYIPEYSAENGH